MEHRGFVLIADITGFTSYLGESEIEHAQGTLTDLLELLVEHVRSPLVVSQLEGDAVMSYAFDDGFVGGQTFLEGIEDTYVAFRRAIELMVLNNTCQCNACANVSSLDLKFFVHHGTFVVQPVGGFNQLLGSDINLIHRLLKNSVTSETGIRAYVLCTEAAAEALGLDTTTHELVDHTETVADFGAVAVSIKDMHPVYEAKRDVERFTYTVEEELGTISTEISMPRELVWDYLSQPEFRKVLFRSDRQEIIDRNAGRIGPGSTFQCYHGKNITPHLVLEWTPFERIMVRQPIPFPGGPLTTFIDWRLTTTESGTRLDQTLVLPDVSSLKRALMRTMFRPFARRAQQDSEAFRDRIQEDWAAHQAAVSPVSISSDHIKSAAAASLQGKQP